MTAEEEIAQLKKELAEERAEKSLSDSKPVHQQEEEEVLARLSELEGRLAKDSHNSSKPPSSDGSARQGRRQRKASEKKTGGQAGHAGRTLMQVITPDEVLRHRP